MELDFQGDMSYYQRQLANAGITKEQVDMDDWQGLTAGELQEVVDRIIELFRETKN